MYPSACSLGLSTPSPEGQSCRRSSVFGGRRSPAGVEGSARPLTGLLGAPSWRQSGPWSSFRTRVQPGPVRLMSPNQAAQNRAPEKIAFRLHETLLIFGNSTLSRAQVAREASEGQPLKLGCAICCQAGACGKSIWARKFCDGPAKSKRYSWGSQFVPNKGFSCFVVFFLFSRKLCRCLRFTKEK